MKIEIEIKQSPIPKSNVFFRKNQSEKVLKNKQEKEKTINFYACGRTLRVYSLFLFDSINQTAHFTSHQRSFFSKCL